MHKTPDDRLDALAHNRTAIWGLALVLFGQLSIFAMRWHLTGHIPVDFPLGFMAGQAATTLLFGRLLRKSERFGRSTRG